MPHPLERRDAWGHGLALWVLVAMAFALPFALWSLKSIDLENNIREWLPADDPQARVLDWYDGRFSPEDRIILSWENAAIDDPRVALFAQRLEGFEDPEGIRRGGSPYVSSVVTPQDALDRMRNSVSPEEAFERMTGVLVGAGPLRLRFTEAGGADPERTRSLVARTLEEVLDRRATLHGPLVDYHTYELPPEVAERRDAWMLEHAPVTDADTPESGEFALGPVPPAEPGPPPPPLGVEPVPGASLVESPYSSWSEHDLRVSWRGMHSDRETTELVRSALEALEDGGEPLIDEAFFTPGAPVAIAAIVTEAGRSDRGAMFAQIDEIAREVGVPPESLRIGGGPYAGHELNKYLEKVTWNPDARAVEFHRRSPFLASMIVGILLSFVMLRSVRMAILVLVTAVYTMLVTVALVPATGGSMNVVLVVMPTLLVVLTISASIHLCNYWRHAAAHGSPRPIIDATRIAFWPTVYAAITTAIGLASLRTSPLAPVRDFGVYSAIGCVLLVFVVLLGLPSMMQFWRGRRDSAFVEQRNEGWRRLGRALCGNATAVSLACLVLFAACTYGLRWFETETKVIKYFPDDTKVVRDYDFLEDNLGGIAGVEFLVRFDDTRAADGEGDGEEAEPARRDDTATFLDRLEVVRNVQRRLERHPEVSGTVSLATFFPVDARPAERNSLATRLWVKNSNAIGRRLKGESLGSGNGDENAITEEEAEARREETRAAKSWFLAAAEEDEAVLDTGWGNGLVVAEGDEVWRISAHVAVMTDADYGDLVGDPRRGRVGALNELVEEELGRHPSAEHVVTGMVPLFLRTQQAVLDSLITSFALAFVIIAIVMMLLLKSVLSGALAMLPNLMPVGVVFGLVAWAEIPVDIGTMITASVALGIAVDGTLHLLVWYREGVARGLSRNQAIEEALAHCGPAMFQTSAVVGCGLLVLASAELLLVHRFGWLMAALIGAALAADVILLPALLAGPLGRLVAATVRGPTLPDVAAADLAPAPLPSTAASTAIPAPAEFEPHFRRVPAETPVDARRDRE